MDRLSSTDLAILAKETVRSPLHNATLEIFTHNENGFSYADLLALIEDRIAYVPRYRQRIQSVPVGLTNPIWVDDPDFELTNHVHRSALPTPGSLEQLRKLVARITSRRLDLTRPLWEVYLIEGLPDSQVAVLTKSHQILVDGVETVDLGQVLLDVDQQTTTGVIDDWKPSSELSPISVLGRSTLALVQDPKIGLQSLRSKTQAAARGMNAAVQKVTEVVDSLNPATSAPENVFTTTPSEQRKVWLVETPLKHYRMIKRAQGGTINDVILATIAGAIRAWLMTRAESVSTGRSLRVLAPMSVVDPDRSPTSLGSQVVGTLLSLPIGEVSPVIRLHQVSYALRDHGATGRAVSAQRIAGVSGFAPTTFHALGGRVAVLEKQPFSVLITNVPGPQFPMYAAGAEMVATYPIPLLLPGATIAIGVTSYAGAIYYGLTVDQHAVPDGDVLAQCIRESLDELCEAATDTKRKAPRGRKNSRS